MDEAITAFNKVLELNPKSVDAVFNLASLYEAKGQREAAQVHYRNS